MIQSEDDVRAYVRAASGGKARWVEPALGSTPGLPDCWVVLGKAVESEKDHCVHLELKAGTYRNGLVRFKIRTEQVRQIIAMRDENVPVGLLVGIKGTTTVLFCLPTPEALTGAMSIHHEKAVERVWHADIKHGSVEGGFSTGVFFIFSGGTVL